MGMTETIWIFQSVLTGGLIARRDPHYYQCIVDPVTGEDSVLLTSGAECACPTWESVRLEKGRSYGTYIGQVYDITDLIPAAAAATPLCLAPT